MEADNISLLRKGRHVMLYITLIVGTTKQMH